MVLYGLLCSLGVRGGLILGMTVAEFLTSYWNSTHTSMPPPQVYVLNRRIHHGELGALLAISSLFLRMSSLPSATIGILAGVGFGLLKDDIADVGEWFKLRKEKKDKRQTSINTIFQIQKDPGISTRTFRESNNDNKSEKGLDNSLRGTKIHKDEQLSDNSEPPLRKQIQSLIEAQSEMLNDIQSQINDSRHLLFGRKGF
jgi:hypothetical protein